LRRVFTQTEEAEFGPPVARVRLTNQIGHDLHPGCGHNLQEHSLCSSAAAA
jgi:hypothetical protein